LKIRLFTYFFPTMRADQRNQFKLFSSHNIIKPKVPSTQRCGSTPTALKIITFLGMPHHPIRIVP
jgi:hypothetical protein